MALQSEESSIHPGWMKWYNTLKEFYDRNGDLHVPRKTPLHLWMRDQRSLAAIHMDDPRAFSPAKKKLLDKLQFRWSNKHRPARRQNASTSGTSRVQSVRLRVKTSTINPDWSARYNEVEEFYTRHGHIKVPSHTRLASWLRWQRQRAKRGSFPAEQKELLDRLGFQWTLSDMISSLWMTRYNEARAYKARHGHLQVRSKSPLGRWIDCWRRKARYDVCPPEKKRLLDKLGFERSSVRTRAHHPSNTLEDSEIEGGGNSMEKGTAVSPSIEERSKEMDDPVPNVLLHGETSTITDAWMARYNELKESHARHGHIQVLCGGPLSTWISKERAKANKGGAYYPAEKKDLLDKLEFQWTLPIISPAWMLRYDELKAFKATHKHLDVPSGKGLGDWFRKERAKAKFQGYKVEKMKLLETLGFKWRGVIPVRLHRHSAIEEAENEDEDDLAKTTDSVISPFTVQSPSEETDDPIPKKKALQDKPFTTDSTWMTWYNEAKEFHTRHGHFRARSENSRLYQWIRRQRCAQAKGGYPSEKKDLLHKIGFRWTIPIIQPTWMTWYNEVKEFHTRHGHIPSHSENSRLYLWIRRQRRAQAKGGYPSEKKDLLDKIGFRWTIPIIQPTWMDRYNEAKQFKTRHGNLQVPAHDAPLSNWLHTQRRQAKGAASDTYPAEKKELLDSLGFQWTIPIISSDWMVRYTELKAVKTRTGHLHLPSRTPLYNWMAQERRAEGKGVISVEKKILLDGLGVSWIEQVPSRVNPSPVLFEEPELDDVEDDSAKQTTTVSLSTTEERPGNHREIMDTLVLRQGSRQRSSEEDDSERPRDQKPAGMKENQKDTGDVPVRSDPASADAGEMPAGGDFPPGWVMRWKKRPSGGLRGGVKDKSWKSPSGVVFKSLCRAQKFLKDNASEAKTNVPNRPKA